jgi:hypothetical protein
VSCSSKCFLLVIVLYLLTTLSVIQAQKTSAFEYANLTYQNRTILPGYLECFLDYKTSKCDSCPPSCLSESKKDIVTSNKELSAGIDQAFEKSLRQLSILKSGLNQNYSNTATIYLQSLLLKNQIRISEYNLISDALKQIINSNSILSIGKTLHGNLDIVKNDKNSSPIALSIVNIASKITDLLINSDPMLSKKIAEYPNLIENFPQQKNWVIKIISSTIVGCEITGITGCLTSSIFASGIL